MNMLTHLRLQPLLVLAFALALFFSWFFSPGLMSFDSLQQYRQVLGIIPLVDSHPVIMVYTWRFMSLFTEGPGGVLLFNQLLYWFAIAFFALLVGKETLWRIVIFILVGFWPPVLILSFHVWKDAGMMAALALASTCIYGYAVQKRPAWAVTALLALFYAIAIRVNGFIPASVLLLVLCYLYFEGKSRTLSSLLTRSFATALALCWGFFYCVGLINSNAHKIYGFGTLAVWDIASVSIAENKNLLPDYLEKKSVSDDPLSVLKEKNNREANYPVYDYVSPYPAPAYQRQLLGDWLGVIANHPLAYLKHRAHVFAVLSGKSVDGRVYYPYHPGIDPNDLGLGFDHIGPEAEQRIFGVFEWFSQSPIYRVYFYELLAVVILVYGAWRVAARKDKTRGYLIASAIAFSGLLNGLSMLILATAADFRYMNWTIFAAILAGCMTFSLRLNERAANQQITL